MAPPKKIKPIDERHLVSRAHFARILGKNDQSVTRFVDAGMPTQLVDGKTFYDTSMCIDWLKKYWEGIAIKHLGTDAYAQAEIELKQEQAKKMRLANLHTEGSIYLIEEARQEMTVLLQEIRGVLTNAPGRYAPTFAPLTLDDAQRKIRELVNHCLEEIDATIGTNQHAELSAYTGSDQES